MSLVHFVESPFWTGMPRPGVPATSKIRPIVPGTAIFTTETVMPDVWSCRLFWQWEGTVGIPPQTRGRS